MMAPPPDYLLLDEMFSLVGSEQFPSEWTGKESIPVMALPSDYWRPPETISEILALSQSAEWLSEDYRYDNEKEINRYKYVAFLIVNKCRLGEYSVFLTHASGNFIGLDIEKVTSEPFQQMIYHPGTPNRDRLRFLANAKSDGRHEHLPEGFSNIEAVTESSKPTKQGARSQETQEMYDTWFQLVDKHRLKEDGTRRRREEIAQKIASDPAARRPQAEKGPRWRSVVRRLNEFHRGWAD